MTLVSRSASLAATMVLCLAATSVAQQAVEVQAAPPASEAKAAAASGTIIKVSGGAGYQFDSDIDGSGNGKFNVQRYGAIVSARTALNESFTLYNVLNYGYAGYEFNRSGPWGDVQTATYNLILDYKAGNDWAFFGGPTVTYSGENGSETNKSFTAGGLVGARYTFSPSLTLGLGIRATTQIEDDGKIAPLPIVDWKISDEVQLKTIVGRPGVPGDYGIELAWAFAPKWELGGGAMAYSSRFRLNDSGPNADGVGKDSGVPLFVAIAYKPTDQLSLSLIGGTVAGGKLRVENSSGKELVERDYNAAPFVGLVASYRF